MALPQIEEKVLDIGLSMIYDGGQNSNLMEVMTMKMIISLEIKGIEESGSAKSVDMQAVKQRASEAVATVLEQYKAENPDIHIEATLHEQEGLTPTIKQLSGREVERFVAYAKEQGTKMPFDSMESGILAAGRKDMQDGLAEILNSLKFDKPEGMENRGLSKKKS